ncbi:MAG: phospho-N-acetylmuramoyl-pentapeptide-transferase [Cyanobacteria bacterium P01_E01_bin.34]
MSRHQVEYMGFPVRWSGTGVAIAAIAGLVTALWVWQPAMVIPFTTSAGITALVGTVAVPLLQRLKTGQIIRSDGPQAHLKKGGTPTMGGIYFVLIGLLLGLAYTKAAPLAIAVAATVLGFGAIGLLDDWTVIRQQSNKGIAPKVKLGLQVFVAILVCVVFSQLNFLRTTLALPLLGALPLGLLFWPLALFVLLGTNNAVNLTDGLDGLAASTVAIALVGLAIVVPHPDLAMMAVTLSGSCVGFLAHNRNPAKVFMGDTGSLALGGALAAIALLGNCLWALAIVGAVFIAEALSVMLQVSYFKYTKRKFGEGQRLLRMSPLHHHLELGGWAETTVVASLCGVTAVLGVVVYGLSLF